MSSVAVPVSSLPRPSAPELRRHLEAELADRIPGALSPRERVLPEMVSSGIAALDELTGGWPLGTLSELFGPASSGRTSVLLAAMAASTARGEACALIDAGDAFDPESAAGAGVDLKKLLWVRCGKNELSPRRHEGTEELPNCRTAELPNFRAAEVAFSEGHGFSRAERPHKKAPALAAEVRGSAADNCYRSPDYSISGSTSASLRLHGEGLGMPEPRDIGIWGYGDTETMERIAPHLTKKNPPQRRRGTEKKLFIWHSQKHSDETSAFQFGSSAIRQFGNRGTKYRPAYARIEQALKAADLLLAGGGFGLVAIDLAGLPPEAARRVPLTTWFRFRRAVEATSTVLLLVGPQPLTQSCAALSLKLQPSAVSRQVSAKAKLPVAGCQLPETLGNSSHDHPITGSLAQFGNSAAGSPASPPLTCWGRSQQFGNPSHAALLTGFRLHAEVIRSPALRKPARNAHAEIETHAQWA